MFPHLPFVSRLVDDAIMLVVAGGVERVGVFGGKGGEGHSHSCDSLQYSFEKQIRQLVSVMPIS